MGRRSAGSPRKLSNTRRWRARLCVVLGIACVLFAVVTPSAGAAYGRVRAEVGCDRVVEWSASASTEGTPDERTNNEVAVEFRPSSSSAEPGAGSGGTWRAAGPTGVFDEENDFTFGGSFELPDGVDSVDLRVAPLSNWGPSADGDAPGDPRFARAELPDACGQQSLDLDLTEDCAAGVVRIELTNLGDTTETADVVVDQVQLRSIDVAPGSDAVLLVPLLDGRDTRVEVRNGDVELADRSFRGDCALAVPSAVVLERCDTRQAVVLAVTDGPDTHVVQTRVDGTIVNRSELRADNELQRTIDLPGGAPLDLEVSIDEQVVALGSVGACDGPTAGLVTCGVGDRPACGSGVATDELPPPPPPPESLNIELPEAGLPVTGPWERGIVLALGGLLLALGGLAVLGHDRSGPRPTPIADSLAPYRQRWWDQD